MNSEDEEEEPLDNDPYQKPLDYYLIDKVMDPATQKIQRWIGLDCFFFAKLTALLAIIVCTAAETLVTVMNMRSMNIINTVLIIFYFVICLRNCLRLTNNPYHSIDSVRQQTYQYLKQGQRNPMIFSRSRNRWFIRTLVMITLVICFSIKDSSIGMTIFTIVLAGPFVIEYVVQCFMACTPLPPQKSVLRQKWEAFMTCFAEREEEGLAPMPT